MIRPIDILVVEDNPGDVRLLREALNENPSPKRLSVVEDGEQAIAYFRRQGDYIEAPRPDLVFLDLNLPKKDGREVLAEIKGDPELRRIPVIVLTTSDAEQDIVRAYDLHANCYVRKPVDLDQFIGVIQGCENFWTNLVKLPPG